MPSAVKKSPDITKRSLMIAFVTVGCLMPFATKAFHIDDPLFIWIGRQIQSNPFDFFGFTANWYGRVMPMSAITQNPPLTSYYIALAASVAGWSETALHIAFWLPAVGAGVGAFLLARSFCHGASTAALVAVLTPAFLVSATNVMSDVLLLCFFVWAIVCWLQALEYNRMVLWALASVLICLALLTKYFGVALLPLLLVYSLYATRRIGWWLVALIIPLLVMVGYQTMAVHLYGRGLFTGAAAYALSKGFAVDKLGTRLLTTLAFTGGTLISAFLFVPVLWSRRNLMLILMLLVLVSAGLFVGVSHGYAPFPIQGKVSSAQLVQLAILAVAGLHIVWLALADLILNRDTKALLLFLWVAGVFVFAALVNWSVNARTILPMAPAVGILVVRRLELGPAESFLQKHDVLRYGIILAAGVLAMMVAWADFSLADSQRAMAKRIHEAYGGQTPKVWFQGHWGFQYYMQTLGYEALDARAQALATGDVVVIPLNNTNVWLLPHGSARLQETMQQKACAWLTTMQMQRGAGFYADVFGPLPFVFGAVPKETYLLYRIENVNFRKE